MDLRRASFPRGILAIARQCLATPFAICRSATWKSSRSRWLLEATRAQRTPGASETTGCRCHATVGFLDASRGPSPSQWSQAQSRHWCLEWQGGSAPGEGLVPQPSNDQSNKEDQEMNIALTGSTG